MEEITLTQLKHLKNRYPDFELSYESMLHNKVPQNYEIHMAIPTGKKYIAWFTFEYERNVLYLFELNKDKKIAFAYKVPMEVPLKLAYGTILYGTFLEFCFVIEENPCYIIRFHRIMKYIWPYLLERNILLGLLLNMSVMFYTYLN